MNAHKIITHANKLAISTTFRIRRGTPFSTGGARVIFLEGSYVNTFSGEPHPTPYYEYNQIMYRLDVSDSRLDLPDRDGAWTRTSGGKFPLAARRGLGYRPVVERHTGSRGVGRLCLGCVESVGPHRRRRLREARRRNRRNIGPVVLHLRLLPSCAIRRCESFFARSTRAG